MQRNQKKKNTNRRKEYAAQPGQYISSVVVTRKVRYQVTTGAALPVTGDNLLDGLCVGRTATTVAQMASAFRLKYIEIWAGPSALASLAPVTVGIEWTGEAAGQWGPSTKVNDTSIGSTRVAHVRASPPKGSQLSQFQGPSTAPLFTVDCSAGAIIDIVMELILHDDGVASLCSSAAIGATPGAIYQRGLDALGSATTNFPPLSFATI